MKAGCKSKKIKILYLLNVDWSWIKQRPHFLAEKLSLLNNVSIMYPFSWRRANSTKNDAPYLNFLPIILIPFRRKFYFLEVINLVINYIYFYITLKIIEPDLLWISSPEFFLFIPKKIKSQIVYDAMDDILEFNENKIYKREIYHQEKSLIDASKIVFCSSEEIRSVLIKRYGCEEKYSVINNAFEPLGTDIYEARLINNTNVENITYIGAISDWFDYKAIEKIIVNFPDIKINLVGPVINKMKFINKNIKYYGAIDHKKLKKFVIQSDVFIMPFFVNNLVKSVDPVKIYEYIYFNKPIISVRYKEVEKFQKFIYLYDTHEQLVALVRDLKKGAFAAKYTNEMRADFIKENNWLSRAQLIQKNIELILTEDNLSD
jgi:hypothetical protein